MHALSSSSSSHALAGISVPRTGSRQPALRLPVAPRCTVQCVYCRPSSECVHHRTCGSHDVLLTPQQAVAYALESIRREPRIASIGVTGPGDPLANPVETLGTFSLLRSEGVTLPFFFSSNGLGLEEHVDELVRLGAGRCIVTVNALSPNVGAKLVDWVQGPGGLLTGEQAARFLIDRQLAGIRVAAACGIDVIVNFRLVPDVNASEVEDVARAMAATGVRRFHIQGPSMDAGTDATRASPHGLRPADFVPTCARVHHAAEQAGLEAARELAAKYLEVVDPGGLCGSDPIGCQEGGVPHVRDALESSSRNKDMPGRNLGPGSEPPCSVERGVDRSVPLRQLQLIARVARWLATSEGSTLDTLRRVLGWLDEELGLGRAVIALADPAGETVQAIVSHNVDRSQEERMRYQPGEGITGQVFSTGGSVFLPSLHAEPAFLDRSGLRSGLDLTKLAFFCVPIHDRGTVIGTLSADKDNGQLKDADSDRKLLEEIAHLVAPFVQRRRLEESLSLYHRLRRTEGPFARLVGRSSAMEEVRLLLAKVAPTPTTVLFTGETGTGKSAAAALVHELSTRAEGPFVDVNCGALPEALIESELFGHERGAFTGAVQRRLGVFERARGGTVFLDEVGELGPSAQTRLLRVLQTRRFERVGGSETLTTDARIVVATNKDLSAAIAAGTFREDLFYRLNVFPVRMPPLRERGKADLMLLADSFVERYGRAMGKPIFRIDTPAIDMIVAYHWPGNVRELENVIERAVVLAEADVIHGHHLPPSLQLNQYAQKPEELDFQARVSRFETELITEALKESLGNQTKAAERLGLTKRVIQYKIRTYGIPWQRYLPKH